jgi:cytochrome c553
MNSGFSLGTGGFFHHVHIPPFSGVCMNRRRPSPLSHRASALLIITLAVTVALALLTAPAFAGDTTPAAQLQHWSAQAGAPGNASQGRVFFSARHGAEWSCASCHGTPLTREGEHASTGKPIAPLAPAFNAKAFTDAAKTDKWFRRNCKDVLSRECSASEKADVLAYLISRKP